MRQRGVSHCGLAIYINKKNIDLKAKKKNCGNSKYFTKQKNIIFKKNPLKKETKILQVKNICHIKNKPIIITKGPKSIKLLLYTLYNNESKTQ
jgi:hypothetical protein